MWRVESKVGQVISTKENTKKATGGLLGRERKGLDFL